MKKGSTIGVMPFCGVIAFLLYSSFFGVGCNRVSINPGAETEHSSDTTLGNAFITDTSSGEVVENGVSFDTATKSDAQISDVDIAVDGGDTENQCLVEEDTETDLQTSIETGTALQSESSSIESEKESEQGEASDTVTDVGASDTMKEIHDSDTQVNTVIKTETEEGSGTDTFAEADTLIGTDSETVTETVSDSLTQTDSRIPTETALVLECDDDMVMVAENESVGLSYAFCMDRYEASRSDATETVKGDDKTIALSRPGVIPWYENPMTADALEEFENACQAAGKRLCTSEEWTYSCRGFENSTYSFGNDFDAERCNSVDTYCDDYCAANDIPSEECNVGTNCGYSCGSVGGDGVDCFHVDPTGHHGACMNGFGAFDVNGNVWEVVPSNDDSRGFEVRGGAFNCASAASRFRCTYNADWTALYAGFRCCTSAHNPSDK